jgi:hypothetical protein
MIDHDKTCEILSHLLWQTGHFMPVAPVACRGRPGHPAYPAHRRRQPALRLRPVEWE